MIKMENLLEILENEHKINEENFKFNMIFDIDNSLDKEIDLFYTQIDNEKLIKLLNI
jgi:hypothetical protein